MYKLTYLAGTACLAVLLPTAVQAQDANEIVVTASGFEQPKDETGQAITVIDEEELRQKQIAVVSDVLREVPSIAQGRNGGIGATTGVFIRGANSSQTLVLIDGVRINDPSTPNGLFDFGTLLTGNIDRVEILRGPNSVIWGSQAIGGVINIRNAAPTDALSANARAEYGSFGTIQAQANIAGTSGIFSGSFGGGYYHTDGINAVTNGSEKDSFENYSLNSKLKIALSDAIAIDLRSFYNNGAVEFDNGFPRDGDTAPETETQQFIGYVGINADFLDGRFRNRIAFTRTETTRDGRDPTPFSFDDNEIEGTIDRAEYHGSIDIAGDLATLAFGLEYEKTALDSSVPARGLFGTADIRGKSEVISGFGQVILRPAAGLTLTGGIRHDDYDRYGNATTFGANAAYTPNGGQTVLRATYAEGFRAPTLSEAIPLFFGANPDLVPETSRSFDVGIEHSFIDSKATARLTYFNRRSNNEIISNPDNGFTSENIARVNAQGAEFELDIRPTDDLTVSGFYAWVESQDRSTGEQLLRRPTNSAGFAADWQAPFGLKLGSTISIVGDSNDFGGVELDGFILAAFRAAMPIGNGFELYGRINNAFDSDYETAAGFNSHGRAGYAGIRARF